MRRHITLLLTLLLVLSVSACGSSKLQAASPPSPEAAPEETAAPIGLSNPWEDFSDLAEAEAAAGFAFPQPEWDATYDTIMYRVMDGIMEVIYEQDDGQYLVLRKGADETDVSGDYNAYDFTEDYDGVTVRGYTDEQGEKLCHGAAWVADGHFYAIYCELSVTLDEMLDMAQRITEAQ